MKRPWILLTLISLGVSGCHSPSTTYDPFLGRSTVPPPSTGVVAPAQPYYSPAGGQAPPFAPPAGASPSLSPMGAPVPLTAPPGALQQPTFQAPPTNAPQNPPGGFGANNVPSMSPDPRFAAASINNTVTIPPTQEPPQLQPNAFAAQARSTPAGGRMFDPAVMPASYNAAAPASSPATVSANKPVSTSSLRIVGGGSDAAAPPEKLVEAPSGAIVAESSRPGATYSYDSSYRALQGKLEYSQSQNRWKLRYIPVDGVTDDFGGSVILSDSPVLSNYQAGDFVGVQGGVAQKSDTKGYAPQFQLSRIARQ